jgi:AhpD family alkylhydroperoxidase
MFIPKVATTRTGAPVLGMRLKEFAMSQRIDYVQQSPELFKAYLAFSTAVRGGAIDTTTRNLMQIRASQINGCAFCLDMHVKEARIHGERELRLHHIAIWRESPLFTAKERAAFAWTEALTHVSGGVPDAVYDEVRAVLSEKEISDLSFVVMAINGWNRLSCGVRAEPGSADAAYGLDKASLS